MEAQTDLAFRGTLAPETEFVLLGARTHLSGARRQRWEKLLKGVADPNGGAAPALNWNAVLRLALSHRVLGLLGRHLSARAWKDVPAPVRAEIQSHFMRLAAHSNALKQELGRVSHLLESAGIPVVSFKGVTLALAAYGNAVVRPSADLDLLVSRAHALRARGLLNAAGYRSEVALAPAQEQIALRVDSVFNLFRPAEKPLRHALPYGYAVELHWAITSPCLPFDLEFETVAPHLGWIELPGTSHAPGGTASGASAAARVRSLAPEDLLLILCVHGAKHLWERLIWLCDLAELVAVTPALDWARVLEAARERGVQRMTALGLTLMRDVLGTPLPRSIETWISTQPEALRLAAQLRRQLLSPAPTPALGKGLGEGQLAGHVIAADSLLMQTIDSRWNRLGFLWHLATVPTLGERAQLNLPASLDFLWRVVRPTRALQRRFFAKPH